MTKDDVLFGYRQQLFAEAARTSVSAACRTFGVHRSTYYHWKRQVDRHVPSPAKTPARASTGQLVGPRPYGRPFSLSVWWWCEGRHPRMRCAG